MPPYPISLSHRIDHFVCGHDRRRVVGNVDVESSVHVFLGIAGGRVLDHRDLITQLGAIANSGFHTRVRDQSHDDHFVDAVLLELQIQIGIGENRWSTNAPAPRYRPAQARTHGGARRPRCHIRKSFATMPLSGSAQCTSRSRSHQDDIGDAVHRRRGCPPRAPRRAPAAYAEHTGWLPQHPSSDPTLCRHLTLRLKETSLRRPALQIVSVQLSTRGLDDAIRARSAVRSTRQVHQSAPWQIRTVIASRSSAVEFDAAPGKFLLPSSCLMRVGLGPRGLV